MNKSGFAFFVKRPRTIEDLLCPHLVDDETEYKIVKTIVLSKIDYENFVTDMLADRKFIEDNWSLCLQNSLSCLFVRQKGHDDGVLIVPENSCYVSRAAYCVNSSKKLVTDDL